MRIGPYKLQNNVIAAPMAGVTDQPFRLLCRAWGAGLAVSEMISSKPELKETRKTIRRSSHHGESEPVAVQIVGADPLSMADAARCNVDKGAQIIDINMGCPAKKVCNVLAGSALLENESLVARILTAVVNAVDVPVTLKMRTGATPENRCGVRIARLAESAGIQALAVHGRTRACRFKGAAEYDTIRCIKQAVSIPVIANGDIRTGADAAAVLRFTQADAVMIGRGAQGAPWIFQQVSNYLRTGKNFDEPDLRTQRDTLLRHLEALYEFYGESTGVRVARKHIRWYTSKRVGGDKLWSTVNRVNTTVQQYTMINEFFQHPRAPLPLAA